MITCEKCGCKLSADEIRECEAPEGDESRWICDECWMMEDNNELPQDTFDSDSGL